MLSSFSHSLSILGQYVSVKDCNEKKYQNVNNPYQLLPLMRNIRILILLETK